MFSTSKLFSNTALSTITSPITSVALTLYHIIILCGTDIYAINRLDDSVVFQEAVVDPGTKVLGLCSDAGKSTFWLFTTDEIYEVVVNDEGRDLWKILLADKSFDAAQRFAKTPAQKDEVSVAQGDHLISYGKYIEAAEVYGKCSKSFEEVALTFLENGEQDALRKYLLTKLSHLKRSVSCSLPHSDFGVLTSPANNATHYGGKLADRSLHVPSQCSRGLPLNHNVACFRVHHHSFGTPDRT